MSDPLNDPYLCGEAYQEAIQKPSKFIWVKIDAEGNYLGHYEWNGHEWVKTQDKCPSCRELEDQIENLKTEILLMQTSMREKGYLP